MASGTDCVPTLVDAHGNGTLAPVSWDSDVGDDGHSTNTAVFLVEVCDPMDGPEVAKSCPDLPACGDIWDIGNDRNPNLFAGCARKAKRHKADEADAGTLWAVTIPYTTKPKARCCENFFDDPLNEPPKVEFEVASEKEEALENWDGSPIETSSHEVVRGPQNEWDRNDFKVGITQNVIDPQLPLLVLFLDKGGAVNDAPLWGFPAGCVRLCSPMKVEENFYGHCYKYYKRTLTFHIKASGHDRTVVDEGTKALSGHWGTSQGSGATIGVTVNGSGGILTASLGSGGSGYPRSATIFLVLLGGTGGVVQARTNGNGVVISEDMAVKQSGSGYGAGTLATAGGGAGWVLDEVTNPCDGTKHSPDPANPADFSRYVDRTGNPATVILDGFGVPYSPCSDVTAARWWCINDGVAAYAVNANCASAVAEALSVGPGTEISGPFDTQALAEADCDLLGYGTGQDPASVLCPDSGPGEVVISRCPPQDLTQLYIPLVIGGP